MNNDYKIIIRETHLDTFGHVNNAKYLEILEEARWDLITKRGYGLAEVMKLKKGPVLLEVNLKFIKELKLREEVTVTAKVLSYEKKICKLEQKIIKNDGSIAAEAIFVMSFFDLKERKLIEPTPEWLKAIDWTLS